MDTKLIKINDIEKEEYKLKEAAEILQSGGLVAFPTETVYGLGANGLDAKASAKIYAAKGRPSDNPLILHICNEAMLNSLAQNVSETAQKLIKAFWPGPMTLILERQHIVPDQVTGGLNTVGIRMPNHQIALALIKLANTPLAAPSANTSGRPSPTNADTVLADLSGKVEMIIDGGSCEFGLESTIIDCTEQFPTILRPGAITFEMIEQVVGKVKNDPALTSKDSIPKAPGMKYTHYAPKAPMVMLVGAEEKMKFALLDEIKKAEADGQKIAVIVSEELSADIPSHIEKAVYGKRTDVAQIAANLYVALRKFDHRNVDIIFAEGTTQKGMGAAIMNRLQKACGYRIIKV